MLRWLRNLVAAISFLLLILITVLWIRTSGYYNHESFNLNYYWSIAGGKGGHQRLSAAGFCGVLILDHGWRSLEGTALESRRNHGTPLLIHRRVHQNRTQIATWAADSIPPHPVPYDFMEGMHHLQVPMWFADTISAVIPALWVILFMRKRRRHRLRRSVCSACGYDLRATPRLCPECGKVPD